ncbi:MAG: OB-fold nucleic acid binding domain-containing protein [Thermofilaceae archaeon]|nr:OB-fold nucleic acid binding domain-containing protein [Thermofilaceae archaeon]MCX8181163.1 OB-fold nucleic acid binding domain-containing protein [Thermofilaceae archaeon]MDW8004786.1 OB-fold nucleic acid binding domain-containing protein [Thermofilaceae archaeon]
MSVVVDLKSVYVRVLPSEIAKIIVESPETEVNFKLHFEHFGLKLRRVRTAGIVEAVEHRGRLAEAKISDDEGKVLVRAWGSDARRLFELERGVYVEIFGFLRIFQGELYVALKLLRKIREEDFSEFKKLIKRDRETIVEFLHKGLLQFNKQ